MPPPKIGGKTQGSTIHKLIVSRRLWIVHWKHICGVILMGNQNNGQNGFIGQNFVMILHPVRLLKCPSIVKTDTASNTAYQLDLPLTSKVHTVFQFSQLDRVQGLVVEPKAVLGVCYTEHKGRAIFIQRGMPPFHVRVLRNHCCAFLFIPPWEQGSALGDR